MVCDFLCFIDPLNLTEVQQANGHTKNATTDILP